jgi:trimethylamine---corrinoid protein Co-methyltransferase
MFERENAPKVLTEEQVQTIHEQAMRILTEIGTDVLHEGARTLLTEAGQRVEDERVRYDPEWIMEQVAKAPTTFPIQARNPARSVVIGEGPPICMNVGGPPFASDLDEGRRSGRLQDHDTLVKMTHATDLLTFVQSGAVEAQDLDVATRHMDMDYSVLRWSDKPYTCYGTSGPKARDALELGAIVFGGHEAIAEAPGMLGIVNPNSPLIWDFRMTDALMIWAEANQGVVVTPFLLAGGTSPVSVAGALSIQVAEALSGVALAQTVRPGAPCMYGSFLTALDMRTG